MRAIISLTFVTTLALWSLPSFASFPPYSGVFSISKEVIQKHNLLYQSMVINRLVTINLIVTANPQGQQFFIQCINKGKAGFGVITSFKKAKSSAVINAGSECPSKTIRVELDYEEAILHFNNERTILMRGTVSVPIVH